MKILVLSDTHLSGGPSRLPGAIYDALAGGVDMILHAGDVTSMDVLLELGTFAPVEAVAGNMDGFEITGKFPLKRIAQVGKFRIGLTHGAGSVLTIEERVMAMFESDGVDCIVFGHSHRPLVKKHGGVLLVNPGSPTDQRHAHVNSYAVIEADKDITARIVRI